jgi:hypothetical protein
LKKIKDRYFVKTLKLIKKNPKNILHIILFDILFLITIGFFYRLIEFLLSKTTANSSTIAIIIYLILTLLYYLILILIYSFFKYLVLNFIKSLFKQTKIDFKQLKKFYLLNLLIFVVFFITFLALNSLFLISAKQEYAPYIFLIINLSLFLIVYTFMNISHTLFSENFTNIKEIVKKTFTIISKVPSYAGIFLINIIAIFIYFVIFYFIGLILKATIFKNYLTSIKYFTVYSTIFTIVTTIFFYLIILFNRIYFYNIARNKK